MSVLTGSIETAECFEVHKVADRLCGRIANAVAFLILAIRNVLGQFFTNDLEAALYPYVLRLLGYLIILAAIVDKNLRRV